MPKVLSSSLLACSLLLGGCLRQSFDLCDREDPHPECDASVAPPPDAGAADAGETPVLDAGELDAGETPEPDAGGSDGDA